MTYPPNDLRFDRSLYVRELQQMLRTLSFRDDKIPLISVDGIFGKETAEAVIAAQTFLQLSPTGKVDYATWTAIVRAVRVIRREQKAPLAMPVFHAGDPPVHEGDRCVCAACAQLMCQCLSKRFSNLRTPPLNGVLDEKTVADIREIQRICDLPVTGQIDERTWNALTRTYTLFGQTE